MFTKKSVSIAFCATLFCSFFGSVILVLLENKPSFALYWFYPFPIFMLIPAIFFSAIFLTLIQMRSKIKEPYFFIVFFLVGFLAHLIAFEIIFGLNTNDFGDLWNIGFVGVAYFLPAWVFIKYVAFRRTSE